MCHVDVPEASAVVLVTPPGNKVYTAEVGGAIIKNPVEYDQGWLELATGERVAVRYMRTSHSLCTWKLPHEIRPGL